MNSVSLIGRLVRDIEVKKSGEGKAYCSFSVAVDKYKGEADFIPCKAFDSTAENIGKYFHKGDKIGLSGVLSTRNYEVDGEKRFAMEVIVRSFDFLNAKKDEGSTVPFEV